MLGLNNNNMNKRIYNISRKAGDIMYTCYVVDNNGLESTNYFDTEQECINYVYWKWENEALFQQNSNELLSNAIVDCKEIDSKNNNVREI